MEEFAKRTWAEIDLDALEYNFKNIRDKVSSKTKILCVLKADAYGHGAEFLVKQYERLGADWYGVSNIDEAIQLRHSGAKKPILIFGYTDPKMARFLSKYEISQALFSYEYAQELSYWCKKENLKLNVHLKIDTGMSRIGFFVQTEEDMEKSINKIVKLKEMKELNVEGAFTHFSVADDITHNKEYTLKQFDNFKNTIDKLEARGISIPIKHCCNSGGIIGFPEMHMDMVRAGVILYGLYPSEESKNKISLKPVMQLKTIVSQIKTIPENISVSYGRTFISDKKMKIASVPIGYADGYSINFSNKADMIVCGKRAHIVGRVCMDQLMLDVSDIDGVKEGCMVTVFGKDGKETISLDELARITNTINYEIVCVVGKRVPRIYYKNGEIKGKISYV